MENRPHSPGGNGVPQPSDVARLRPQARQAVGRDTHRSAVLRLLNAALATEIVCALRYRRHYFTALGLVAESVRQEFLEHAQQELAHADRIASRIVELNGEPDFNPRGLTERSHAEYIVGHTLESILREQLVAERIAIDSYRQMITYLGVRDLATRRMMEEILASEEEHAADLASLLQGASSAARAAR